MCLQQVCLRIAPPADEAAPPIPEPQAAEPPASEPSVAKPPATPEESAPPSEPVLTLEPGVVRAPESEGYQPRRVHRRARGDAGPISLPEPVPAIAEEPKPASAAPAPEEPQPQRAVEDPAQEPAPAVDEAAYFDLVLAAPMHMHTIAEASPGSASETIGVEGSGVAVPPRQWADEGVWDSRAVFMPLSAAVPAAATIADNLERTTRTPSQTRSSRRGLPRNEDEFRSLWLITTASLRLSGGTLMPARNPHGSSAALRVTLILYCEALPRCPRTNGSRFAPGTRSARCTRLVGRRASACLGMPINPCARARSCVDRERGLRCVMRNRLRALGWRRARARSVDFEYRGGYKYAAPPPRIRASRRRGFDTGERVRAHSACVAACEEVRCVCHVPRTRAVRPAAVLTRSCMYARASSHFSSGAHTAWLEVVYSGAGVTNSVARDGLVLYASK
ncbi:hypothetical protein FB451DRAFT_1181180 [Mycena latifolia]|nr:hypothetical protein FB451DRAFT_1181180 [Mycena latifolia]